MIRAALALSAAVTLFLGHAPHVSAHHSPFHQTLDDTLGDSPAAPPKVKGPQMQGEPGAPLRGPSQGVRPDTSVPATKVPARPQGALAPKMKGPDPDATGDPALDLPKPQQKQGYGFSTPGGTSIFEWKSKPEHPIGGDDPPAARRTPMKSGSDRPATKSR